MANALVNFNEGTALVVDGELLYMLMAWEETTPITPGTNLIVRLWMQSYGPGAIPISGEETGQYPFAILLDRLRLSMEVARGYEAIKSLLESARLLDPAEQIECMDEIEEYYSQDKAVWEAIAERLVREPVENPDFSIIERCPPPKVRALLERLRDMRPQTD